MSTKIVLTGIVIQDRLDPGRRKPCRHVGQNTNSKAEKRNANASSNYNQKTVIEADGMGECLAKNGKLGVSIRRKDHFARERKPGGNLRIIRGRNTQLLKGATHN